MYIIDRGLTVRKGWGKVSRVAFSLHFGSKNAHIKHFKMLSNRFEKVVTIAVSLNQA